jgi:YD repeat-containing protein
LWVDSLARNSLALDSPALAESLGYGGLGCTCFGGPFALGRRGRSVSQLGDATTFRYIDLDAITDFAGRVTGMTCDAAGRLTSDTRPDPDASGMPRL